MDVAYINPFIRSTRSVIETMNRMPVMSGKAYLKDRAERLRNRYALSTAIELSGGVTGIVALTFTESAALGLASGMMGEKALKLEGDCLDALREVTSMIAGSAKKDLPGGLVKLGLPKLLKVDSVPYPPGCSVIGIPWDSGCGRFILEITFKGT